MEADKLTFTPEDFARMSEGADDGRGNRGCEAVGGDTISSWVPSHPENKAANPSAPLENIHLANGLNCSEAETPNAGNRYSKARSEKGVYGEGLG